MSNVYRIAKYVLLGLALVYVAMAVIFEAGYSREPLDDSRFIVKITKPYQVFRSFMEADPYNNQILEKVEFYESSVMSFFEGKLESLYDLATSPRFMEEMFSYAVFKRIDDMNPLVLQYFGVMSDFKDLIIIDSAKNVIYKYGGESFSINYYPVDKTAEVIDFGSLYGIVYPIHDATLDYDYEIIAFFNFDGIRTQVYSSPFPSFIALGDKVVVNDRFPLSLYEQNKRDIELVKKTLVGLKILKPIAVNFDDVDFGYAGALYPVRSILSYLLILLKIVLIGVVGAGFYFLDRVIKNLIGKLELNKDEKTFKSPVVVQKTSATPETTEEDNLVWIKNYIRETEEKK